jgi:hypothetical protein
MGCEDEELYDELEEEEDFEDDEDVEEEEVEVYTYIEDIRRQGNIIEIEVGTADVCCTNIIQLSVDQALKLVRELAKKLNKDEVKQLFSALIDAVYK